jgi:futalosine hydrolase
VLVTGVGMVATATACARALASGRYEMALNVGVCGSFSSSLSPGAVVNIVKDCFPELGAEDGEAFLSIHELGLLGEDEAPYSGAWLQNPHPLPSATLQSLPRVRGVTVNTVTGAEATVETVMARLSPHVESMEGAAFMYACLTAGVPFAQIRAVSNRVERRNRASWKMGEALTAMTTTVAAILTEL